jgi:TRAP-type C4-dicarboxylate transport system permease small subunit
LDRFDRAWGRLLEGFALCACLLIAGMALMICMDVLLRNVALVPGVQGLAWANELSETALYLITVLAAPWLLRQGQHIRVDIVLRILPRQAGWACEWVSDAIAFFCCLCVAYYGAVATWESYAQGSLTIKTLVLPEWWSLAPLPAAFALLAVEVLLRMRRLWLGERAPRDDTVSAS